MLCDNTGIFECDALVGSFQTSLLMALLGELRALKGSCRVQGQVGYASQVRLALIVERIFGAELEFQQCR